MPFFDREKLLCVFSLSTSINLGGGGGGGRPDQIRKSDMISV